MRSSLLFGGDLSFQPSQRRLLFASARLPIECWLEQLSCGEGLQRYSEQQTEEILLIRGELGCDEDRYSETYLCLPPGESEPPFCAGESGATLLRLVVGSEQFNTTSQAVSTPGKARLLIGGFAGLAWNEIPARRENDPGARITELSTNPSRTRITSLMDCRPGWRLDDHDHPSDVLTFCVRGGGLLGIEEQSLSYATGQLIVIPAGVRHRFHTGAEGALLIVFVFEPFLFAETGGRQDENLEHPL